MPLNRSRSKKYLQICDFESLFIEELGWDKSSGVAIPLLVEDRDLRVDAIAEKRGFTVFHCVLDRLPDRVTSLKLDRQLTEYSRSHLLIFSTEDKSAQVWLWVRQEKGKPLAPRLERYQQSKSGESLLQKLEALVIDFEEEEKLTLPEVNRRIRKAFDVEKVTKKFFQRFEKEHRAFLQFIDGIEAEFDRTWYASLMLNRLMFVYFIQKKGFLDRHTDYLRDRLTKCQAQGGTDEFYSFYRVFLLRLFHEGLGQSSRNPELEILIGKVPYLNGGLFEVHQLEDKYPSIQIPDDAFTKIFDFFDEYQWHLDDRPLRQDNEINPDVLGYIFEKYINQKQMGAYYTKEDITEYISKNTIIPFLFDAAAKKCAVAFKPDGKVWTLLRETPDRYIYEAVRKGVDEPLPPEIAAGIDSVAQRDGWNRPAGDKYALPTETWREHVARRQRCLDLRAKLANGDVTSINDLITYNLDIRQFAQDAIVNCEGADLLLAFYQAISQVSVLDPTCGSGAFLFAALNILEPLYNACLERMQGFVDDADTLDKLKGEEKNRYQEFRDILAAMATHPNRRYFILKSIILNNLYGVDIMEEATEICKLRLFLKLVSQVEVQPQQPNLGLEPLPDIDFNIRAGNTLVGYVSLDEISQAIFSDEGKGKGKRAKNQGNLFQFQQSGDVIHKAGIVDSAFQQFRKMQTSEGLNSGEFKRAKQDLRVKLAELNDELNYYLARQYGVDVEDKKAFVQWQSSHQPFHWFVEFYKIISDGGFDVIIGNPPYVEYRVVKKNYQIKGYLGEDANNLYAFCMERSAKLLTQPAWFGMIVPTSVVGLDDTSSLRSILLEKLSTTFCSTYSIRPSKLFEGVDQRLCIYLAKSEDNATSKILASKYYHWNSDERELLFSRLEYSNSFVSKTLNRIAQTGKDHSTSIIKKIENKSEKIISNYYSPNKLGTVISYHRSPRYWIRAINFDSYFKSSSRSKSIHHVRNLIFSEERHGKFIGALLNTSLFFFWFISLGNGRNITGSDVHNMPIGKINDRILEEVSHMFDLLMEDYQSNSFIRIRQDCEFQEFRQSLSKPIIDKIDRVLAQHYGFTDEELDFIINYDIKYRMGRDNGEEE
jgi:type I restriction-modification system DNA methylase subunit